jgi:hypothetical protein
MIERDRGSEALEARTREFALRVIRLVASLPRGLSAHVIGRQLLRAATSVGANYRAACRAHGGGGRDRGNQGRIGPHSQKEQPEGRIGSIEPSRDPHSAVRTPHSEGMASWDG